MFPTLYGGAALEIAWIGFAAALVLAPFLHPLVETYFLKLLDSTVEDLRLEPLVIYGALGAMAGVLLPASYGTTPLSGIGPGVVGGVVAYAVLELTRWLRRKTTPS